MKCSILRIALVFSHVHFSLVISLAKYITENYSVFINNMFVYLCLLATKLKVKIIRLFENKYIRLILLKTSLIVPTKLNYEILNIKAG